MYFGTPKTESGDGGGETSKEEVLKDALDEFRPGLEGKAK